MRMKFLESLDLGSHIVVYEIYENNLKVLRHTQESMSILCTRVIPW